MLCSHRTPWWCEYYYTPWCEYYYSGVVLPCKASLESSVSAERLASSAPEHHERQRGVSSTSQGQNETFVWRAFAKVAPERPR